MRGVDQSGFVFELGTKSDPAGSGYVCCAEGAGVCREWSEYLRSPIHGAPGLTFRAMILQFSSLTSNVVMFKMGGPNQTFGRLCLPYQPKDEARLRFAAVDMISDDNLLTCINLCHALHLHL